MMMNEKYKIAYELCKQDIELGLYDNLLVAVAIQIGRLSAFLKLSDFTEDERANEENKLRELCKFWKKKDIIQRRVNKW